MATASSSTTALKLRASQDKAVGLSVPIPPDLSARHRSEHDQPAATFMVILLATWLVVGALIAGMAVLVYR